MPPDQENPQDFKLLIEALFETESRMPLKKFEYPIQNRRFRLGFRVKNLGDRIFPGATLRQFEMYSLEDNKLRETITKDRSIPLLNPREVQDLWVSDMKTYLTGLVWIKCNVTPQNKNQKIITYQKERATGEAVEPQMNYWGNGYFIESPAELAAQRTNFLVLVITFLTFFEASIGLKTAFNFCLGLFAKWLSFLLNIVNNIKV